MCKYCKHLDKEYFDNAEEGALRVWWIPQIPMEAFHYPVKNTDEAVLLINALAQYDLFQFEHNVKPDYLNANGLEVLEDGEWVDYYDEDGRDISEIMDD